MAVGSGSDPIDGAGTTLIESWNGRAWSVVPSPNRGTSMDGLSAVSCVSRTWCVGVGDYEDTLPGGAARDRPLIESWNGKTSSVVPNPGFAATLDFVHLLSVSCTSTTACVTVGYAADGAPHTHRVIEQWNGKVWTLIPALPSISKSDDALSGVSCPSSQSCQAVGSYVDRHGIARTLIESWTGQKWSITPSPNAANEPSGLQDLSCASVTTCQAIGTPNEAYG